MTEQEIRQRLRELTLAGEGNYGEILRLSTELAAFDKANVRFSVDAGVIDRLGSELVARQETAVSELVKNAYDADSTQVTLTFIDSNQIGGTLKIKDDGDGMTREELINGFMRISSTDKVHNPKSRRYKRTRAGRKGIGRFAVQRLGEKLIIITQTVGANEALKLTIDWNSFEPDSDLQSVANQLVTIPKVSEQGTSLIIDGLRDKWTLSAIQRVYRYVSDIIQPFPLSQKRLEHDEDRMKDTLDPGFTPSFIQVLDRETKTVANTKLMVYNHATAIIEGTVDQEGKASVEVHSEKLNIEFEEDIGKDPDDKESKFSYLKDIHFRAYYFIYTDDLIPKTQKSSIQELARKSGGIRLYRNGFRVLPYGEPGDDWMSLDKSSNARVILPPHANLNFFGFVELDDPNNEFVETSSREGLKETDGFIELKNFVFRCVMTGMLAVNRERKVKLTASQKKDEEGNWEEIEFRIKDIASTLAQLDDQLESDTVEAKRQRRKRTQKIKKQLSDLEKLRKSEQAKMIKERAMLRVLSSVGLTVGQFIHEIKYHMDSIDSDIRFLLNKLESNKVALERLTILNGNFSNFRTYTSYFDRVVSQNVVREIKPLNLPDVVRPFIRAFKTDSEQSNIRFNEPVFHRMHLYSKPMHPSEWSSILFNFYTNSKKAINRVERSGNILIECGEVEETNMVYLEFSDNGDGIPKEDEERVFDEFHTTTASKDIYDTDENQDIAGTGLGLKIVKDIVKSYRGNVFVASPKGEYMTCMRVELPRASQKELEEYGL